MFLITLLTTLLFSVPEPGIMLYGYIRDDSCVLNEATTLKWTVSSADSEEIYTFEATIKASSARQGLLFYRVHLPLATVISGCVPPENAILVNGVSQRYTLKLSTEGNNLERTDVLQLSAKDRGTFRRWSFTW